jgi:hypothetical protein
MSFFWKQKIKKPKKNNKDAKGVVGVKVASVPAAVAGDDDDDDDDDEGGDDEGGTAVKGAAGSAGSSMPRKKLRITLSSKKPTAKKSRGNDGDDDDDEDDDDDVDDDDADADADDDSDEGENDEGDDDESDDDILNDDDVLDDCADEDEDSQLTGECTSPFHVTCSMSFHPRFRHSFVASRSGSTKGDDSFAAALNGLLQTDAPEVSKLRACFFLGHTTHIHTRHTPLRARSNTLTQWSHRRAKKP